VKQRVLSVRLLKIFKFTVAIKVKKIFTARVDHTRNLNDYVNYDMGESTKRDIIKMKKWKKD